MENPSPGDLLMFPPAGHRHEFVGKSEWRRRREKKLHARGGSGVQRAGCGVQVPVAPPQLCVLEARPWSRYDLGAGRPRIGERRLLDTSRTGRDIAGV